MIVGHLGAAAALGRVLPRASLWWLVPAAVAPDLLDLAYTLAGFCNPYGLYSHTVPVALLTACCLAGVALLAHGRATALGVFLIVLAHLPLDFVTGRKLFWPGGELMGLRLYEHPLADFLVESLLLAGGWHLLRSLPGAPRWATGTRALALLVLLQGAVGLSGARKPNACAGPTGGGAEVRG